MCKCLTDHREAACRLRLNENNDAMNAFHNAAKSYKKSNPEGVCRPICHLIRVEGLQLKRTDRFAFLSVKTSRCDCFAPSDQVVD